MVDQKGFEPSTSGLQNRRSTKLSYRPMWWSGGGCPPGMHPPGGQPLRPVCKTKSAGPEPTAHCCTRQQLRPRVKGGFARRSWWRGWDSNPRPPAYEAGELPDCSTPRRPSGGTAPGGDDERRRDCGPVLGHLSTSVALGLYELRAPYRGCSQSVNHIPRFLLGAAIRTGRRGPRPGPRRSPRGRAGTRRRATRAAASTPPPARALPR